MSEITRSIFAKLNESSEVKKTYGDKPQEGKTEKLHRGKTVSIPKTKNLGKFRAEKLKSVNKEAGDIYINDTDKTMDKVDSKQQSDRGKIAKVTTNKSDKSVKTPYGDKVEKSDSNLIKESDELEECGEGCKKECAGSDCGKKELKEDYDNGTWKKHQDAIEAEIDAAKEDMDADAFADFCDGVINYCQNCTGELNQFECDKIKECGKVAECDKVEECGIPTPDSSIPECDKTNK